MSERDHFIGHGNAQEHDDDHAPFPDVYNGRIGGGHGGGRRVFTAGLKGVFRARSRRRSQAKIDEHSPTLNMPMSTAANRGREHVASGLDIGVRQVVERAPATW